MNLEPAPRQSKLVFLAVDAGLLLTAFLIVFFAKDPYAPLPFVSAVLCVALAAIVGLVPFLTDYAADSAEYVQAERGRVAEQVQRLHAASESLARAAAQIKAVEEAVHKTAHTAENLPYRMQEKLAEFNEALAGKDNEERDALERELDELRAANVDSLKGVAAKLDKTTAEWSALEASTRKQLTAAQEASTKLSEQLRLTLAQIEDRVSQLTRAAVTLAQSAADARPAHAVTPATPAPAAPAPTANVISMPEPAEEPATSEPAPPPAAPTPSPFIKSVTLTDAPPASTAASDAKARKARPPKKVSPEDLLAAMSSESAEELPLEHDYTPAPEPAEETPARTTVEASASSDGATRLLVTAYIGIGNKLFIRGEGPGLSWDKGVPMQFVSIGKWGWASHDLTAPAKCKLYKNDDTPALSGEVTLEPGKHIEFTALF